MLLNIFVFAGLLFLFFYYIFSLDIPNFVWDFWGGFGAGLAGFVNWALEGFKVIILSCLAFGLSYYSFSMIGMVLASPLNDILAQRIEEGLCQTEASSVSLSENVKSTALSGLQALRLAGRQTFFTVLALPFILIPIAGFIPFLLVSSWYGGLGYFDVSLARNHFRKEHKMAIVKKLKWKIMGLGLAMTLLFMIPFLNLLLLPVAVVAGSYLYCQVDWQEHFKEENLQPPPGHI
jgi:CysZ protein